MNTFHRILFAIALLILSTQTVRHVYVRWLEPRGSVLDRYEPPVAEDIAQADSLDHLVALYDEAHQKVQAADAEAEKKSESDDDSLAVRGGMSEKEPYKSESMLKAAIQDWEKKSGEIHELRFFWFSGLFFLIAGVVSYRGGRVWLGLSLLFAAFSEMIYATSPSFFGSSTEFDRLLGNKLLFSALSLLLLLLTALLLKPVVDRLAPGRNSAAQPA